MGEVIQLRGTLTGHGGWVTAIATTSENPNLLLSASRDKTIIVWDLQQSEGQITGTAKRALRGHNHFVSDVVISSDGNYALSGSWDGTLRLWEISTGKCTRRFVGHTKDVLSVSFSADNRQIVSGSRDRTVKLWNTLGECKFSITGDEHNGHRDWVSCVRFSPSNSDPVIVSAGWDKVIKVWSLSNCKLKVTLSDHEGYLNTVTVSPDGSLCASGGKDGTAMLWDLSEGKKLKSLDANDTIHSLVFSPNRYWLVAATTSCIKIWDLASKHMVDELKIEKALGKNAQLPYCTSLAWSSDGSYLYAGYTDNVIRIYHVTN